MAAHSQGASLGLTAKAGGLLLFAVGLFLFLPTVLYLVVTMLPTAVALVIDRSATRSGWLCVGGLNFAAACPGLFDLWFTDPSLEHATTMITDVFSLLIVYGAAALGWVIYLTTPQIIGAFMEMTSSRRITRLKAQQKQLVEDWGQEVAREEME